MIPAPGILIFGGNHLWLFAIPLSVAGLLMVYLGLRDGSQPNRIVLKAEPLPTREPREEKKPEAEIVRLSHQHDPLSPNQMSQQSRIAAALLRAGITNPAAWAAAGVEQPPANMGNGNGKTLSASGAAASPAAALERSEEPQALFMKINSPEMQARASLFGGAALLLLSIYIVLTHLGWL